MAEFLPNAVDHWDAARALECINAASAFATQAHHDAAQTLCRDGPAKSMRPQLPARLTCRATSFWRSCLSAEVIALVHRQAHQKPPDALLSVLELLEDKQLGKYKMPAQQGTGYVNISLLWLFCCKK
jgi:hypothetical protein